MTPQAQEAFTVESNWYEANGIEPDPDTDAWAHKLAQDMWAAALQWAAQQAEQQEAMVAVHDDPTNPAHACLLPFASLLRQETITPSPEGKP